MSKGILNRLFKDLPIRHKLVVMILVVTLVSLLVGFGLVVADSIQSFKRNEWTRISHLTRLVADFSTGPVAFDDVTGAEQRLQYLEQVPGVIAAEVVRKNGELFSWWLKEGLEGVPPIEQQPNAINLFSDYFSVRKPVNSGDEYLGDVTLVVSTGQLWVSIWRYLGTMLAIMGGVLVVSFVLAYRLQKAISEPILKLAAVTRSVSSNANYQVEVEREEKDELADLYQGFNHMLGRIHQRELERDQALVNLADSHERLEHRVLERTADLTWMNAKLSDEILERQRAEELLQASLSEKVVLLREIHHRVKNNLQVIYGLLSLQSLEDDVSGHDLLEDSRRRVKTMALVHETLYRSDGLSRVHAPDFVEHLARDISGLYQGEKPGVDLTTDVVALELSLDQAIPAGLILNELLTNAFKYAFPDRQKGRVEINLRRVNEHLLELEVADDGVGLPEGVDWRTGPSLGLRLVMALTSQLRGEISLNDSPGTRFAIRFEPAGEEDAPRLN